MRLSLSCDVVIHLVAGCFDLQLFYKDEKRMGNLLQNPRLMKK